MLPTLLEDQPFDQYNWKKKLGVTKTQLDHLLNNSQFGIDLLKNELSKLEASHIDEALWIIDSLEYRILDIRKYIEELNHVAPDRIPANQGKALLQEENTA